MTNPGKLIYRSQRIPQICSSHDPVPNLLKRFHFTDKMHPELVIEKKSLNDVWFQRMAQTENNFTEMLLAWPCSKIAKWFPSTE